MYGKNAGTGGGWMRRRSRGKRILGTIVLVLLLAAVCFGGAALAVCRVADPALFRELTAPVSSAVSSTLREAGVWLSATWEILGSGFDELQTRAEQQLRTRELERVAVDASPTPVPPERVELSGAAQLAGKPAIETEFVPVDPSITELVNTGAGEYLLGGNVLLRYYNQADPAWAEAPFGSDPVGTHGCGPTALAMAVSSLTGTVTDPAAMAAWAGAEGYSAPHSGSYLSIVEGTAEHYGLTCESLDPEDPEGLYSRLAAGGVVVALMGPGHFTRGGHFILLHGVTLTGELLAADPYSRENSLMVWTPELICSELSASRYNGSPLWLLTLPMEL